MFKFFEKKTGAGATSKARANLNEGLAQELHKLVIKKHKRRIVDSRFKVNIWTSDLAKIGSLSSFNHGVKYFLCAVDVFNKNS